MLETDRVKPRPDGVFRWDMLFGALGPAEAP